MKTIFAVCLIAALWAPLAATPRAAHAEADAAGAIAGVVFFDSDGSGSRDAGEKGLSGVSLTATDAATGGKRYAASTVTALDGSYQFLGLGPDTYVVTESDLPGYASTTTNMRLVNVVTTVVPGIDFGDAIAGTIYGTVFEDRNGDDIRGLGEPAIPDALVELYLDLDADGHVDPGEPRLAFTWTDGAGNYRFPWQLPGYRVIHVQIPGGAVIRETGVRLVSSQVSGFLAQVDFPLVASVAGLVWNDRDGDQIVDPDEPPLPGVTLYLYRDPNGNGQIDAGEPLAAKAVTDAGGNFALTPLTSGPYVLRPDDGTLPPGYVVSLDAAALAFTLAPGEARRLEIGTYDPLAVAPLRMADWRRELKREGHTLFTDAQLEQLIAAAEAASPVFPETAGLRNALLLPAKTDEERARRELAALRLNLASGRLLLKTPVNLPELTSAATIGAATAEVEALLWPAGVQPPAEYKRAHQIAESLNKGTGVGYGITRSALPALATYRGADVTAKLGPGGGTVDQYTDLPLYLLKWKTSGLDPNLNLLNPFVRLTVKSFHNGGVLEVVQRMPDGQEVSLGTAVPNAWNKEVNATFAFYLRNVSTVTGLAVAELRLYVRDPSEDGGPKEHVRVDATEVIFAY